MNIEMLTFDICITKILRLCIIHLRHFLVYIIIHLKIVHTTIFLKEFLTWKNLQNIIIGGTVFISLGIVIHGFHHIIYFFITAAFVPKELPVVIRYMIIGISDMGKSRDSVSKSSYHLHGICERVKHRPLCHENISYHQDIWLLVQLNIQCTIKTACHPIYLHHLICIPIFVCPLKSNPLQLVNALF